MTGDALQPDDVPFPELSPAQLRAIVDRHGLDIGGSAEAIQRLPSTGIINSIWALGDRWVLRVAKTVPEGVSDTRTESVAVPVVCATSAVRTPALVAFDDSGSVAENLYTIYERVHGVTLDPSVRPPAAVLEDLGVQLALLHRDVVECPDPHGWLDEAGRWEDIDRVLGRARSVAPWLEGALGDGVAAAVASWSGSRAAGAGSGSQRFLHNDVQPSNVLVIASSDSSEAVLIDWGDAGWGDAATDLRSLPIAWLPSLLRGYRSVMPFDGDSSGTAEQRIVWDHACRALMYAETRPWLLAELRAFAEAEPESWSAWTAAPS